MTEGIEGVDRRHVKRPVAIPQEYRNIALAGRDEIEATIAIQICDVHDIRSRSNVNVKRLV